MGPVRSPGDLIDCRREGRTRGTRGERPDPRTSSDGRVVPVIRVDSLAGNTGKVRLVQYGLHI
ncbi:hypothetical protein BN903_20 [Halorubrum sp. AJ67]|nr:hypothetical protein BN903_20 [Halorubrum sp. AJ67]